MLLGTVGFTIALSMQTSSTYEYYMNQAGNSMNEEESAQMYKNAIETDPSRIDGYSALLDLYSNNDFTADEYESFKNILNKDNYEEIVKSADPLLMLMKLHILLLKIYILTTVQITAAELTHLRDGLKKQQKTAMTNI